MIRIFESRYKGHLFSFAFYSRVQLWHDIEKFKNEVDFVFNEVV